MGVSEPPGVYECMGAYEHMGALDTPKYKTHACHYEKLEKPI